ncbi:MAG: cache domain-containing protein [Lachnospiraceae bacterium]|nr:cache domain-containing protein [Lachnospiraceae bacterium]
MEVMIGVPVYVNGELKAVCGGSRLLSDMEEMIENMDLSADSYICLINETGNVVYS